MSWRQTTSGSQTARAPRPHRPYDDQTPLSARQSRHNMTSYRSKNSFRRTATPQSARGAGSSSTQQPILQGKLPAVDLSKKSIASSKRRFSLKSVPSFRTRNNKALEKEDLQQSKATFASHILQVQDLLQECKKFARATKEHKLLAHVSQATERLSKDHDYIIDKVYRNIDELGKVKNERQHTDRQLELLQTKIRNLNFEKWTDQVALQESITALESDIKIINSNGPLMELPEYEYSLHPVANLVFQKFRRLEEVVFLLKKKVAMQRPIASVNDGGVVVVDRSLESIEVDNNDLKKRNRKLVALVKKLRNRLGSAADNLNLTANSAFNFTSRSLITTAGSTDSGDGGNGSIGAGPIKLEPEVYMFTSKYNRMLAALFSDYSNGIPIPPTGVVNFDEIRKFNANINIVQMLVLAKSFNIVPALITRETFEDIFRECNRQSQDVLDEHIDTMTFAQFKEFFARVALTNTRSFPGQTPSQLDQVKLMLYNIDMIAQDKIYRWQERQNHNPQGVMAHLARYDDQFRAMYCGYAKLRSAVGRLMEGQDTKIHVDVKLRMNYSEFLELASDFGLFPDLLTQVQLREVFQKCAVSDVETRAQNARHLTYPDFKMAFTHLSVKANSYFPSLDSHSLFEQGFDSNLTVLSDFLNYLQITDVDAVSMTQRVATYKAQDNSPLETVNKYILNGNQNSDSTRSSNAIAAKRPATGSDTNPFQKEASAESWVTVLRPFEQTLKDIFVFYGHTQLSDLPQLMDQKDIGLGFDQHIGSVVNGDASGSAVSINFSSANPLSHDSVEEEGAETSGSAADTSDEVLTSTRFNLHELIMFCDDFFLTPCLIEKEIIEHAFISCGRNVKSNTVGGSSSAPNSFALKTGTLTFREFKECLARLAHRVPVDTDSQVDLSEGKVASLTRYLDLAHNEDFQRKNALKKASLEKAQKLAALGLLSSAGVMMPAVQTDETSKRAVSSQMSTRPKAIRQYLESDGPVSRGQPKATLPRPSQRKNDHLTGGLGSQTAVEISGGTGSDEHVETTFAWIKPDAVAKGYVHQIISRIETEGFEIMRQERMQLTKDQVATFYEEHAGRSFFPTLQEFMTSGPVIALALRKEHAITEWRNLIGPTDSIEARSSAPSSLRALYGTNKTYNGFHGSDSIASAVRESSLVFDKFLLAGVPETTFAMIKPDAVAAGNASAIISRLQEEHFEIVASQEVTLTKEQAKTFYIEHAGKPFFPKLMDYVCSGPLIALTLKKENAIKDWRKLIGPTDSIAARESRPNSLRALFGTDGYYNAVHGSDSRESAVREYHLMFDYFVHGSDGRQTTFAWIKPGNFHQAETIIEKIQEAGFSVIRKEVVALTREQAADFFRRSAHKHNFDAILASVTSGPMMALALRKESAVRKWKLLLASAAGATSKHHVRLNPHQNGAEFFVDLSMDFTKEPMYGSDSLEDAKRDLKLVFGDIVGGSGPLGLHLTTFAWLKPDVVKRGLVTKIMTQIEESGFEIVDSQAVQLTRTSAGMFYAEHANRAFFPRLVSFMTSGPAVALALRKENAIKAWRDLIGPTDSKVAKETAPYTFRSLYGTDKTYNAFHGSDSIASAEREAELVFKEIVGRGESVEKASLQFASSEGLQTAFAWITPDSIERGFSVEILKRIKDAGFLIAKQFEIQLSRCQAETFYASLKSIDRKLFDETVAFMTSGSCIALALQKYNAVESLQELISKGDASLRSLFATSAVQSAVYGSVDIECAERELNLVFGAFERGGDGKETTFAWIKPDAVLRNYAEPILQRIRKEGFDILSTHHLKLTATQVGEFYAEHKERSFFPKLVQFMTSGPVIGLALRKENAIKDWRRLCGPTDVDEAKKKEPNSLRALYGTNKTFNATHGSDSPASAQREVNLVCGSFVLANGGKKQITFAWLKPDVVAAGHSSAILKRIQEEGFEVIAKERRTLTESDVRKFYAEHVGKKFFPVLTQFMTSGPAIALALCKENAIKAWRECCGPTHPETAKKEMPHSIRALYGTNQTWNAVHGSDSEASARRELGLVLPRACPSVEQSTFAFIKPDAVANGQHEQILQRIKDEGFEVLAHEKMELKEHVINKFYAEHKERSFFPALRQFMSSGPVVALVLRKADGIMGWRALCGPTNSVQARIEAPNTLRALYGTNTTWNAVHGSDSIESFHRETKIIFPDLAMKLLQDEGVETIGKQVTFGWIRPDVVKRGSDKEIFERLEQAGFEIVRREAITLNKAQCQEFYPELVGKPCYESLETVMTSGPSVALMLRRNDAVEVLKDLCGPQDSNVARKEEPSSLRALYGINKTWNAIHAADSPELAQAQLKLVFYYFLSDRTSQEKTFAWIKPDCVMSGKTDAILKRIQAEGFDILQQYELCLTKAQVQIFYAEHVGKSFFPALQQFMTSGPAMALCLRKNNAIKDWRKCMGPTNPKTARQDAPLSIRALFGTNVTYNGTHGSDSKASAERELKLVFGQFLKSKVEKTFAWIKPNAYKAGKAPFILKKAQASGFDISQKHVLHLTIEQAREFYKEHAGKPFFEKLVHFMTSGPVMAVEFTKMNAVKAWRSLMGPTNPDEARRAQPNSIRAIVGTSVTYNAVHGSDSRASARREIELVFGQYVPVEGQSTFALIKPDAIARRSDDSIITRFKEEGFEVVRSADLRLNADQVRQLFADRQTEPAFDKMLAYLTSGLSIALELKKNNAVQGLLNLLGPTDSNVARMRAPTSLRALHGTNALYNGIHASLTSAKAASELNLVFEEFAVITQVQTTFAWIKPDAFKHREQIMKRIQDEGFFIVNAQQVTMTTEQAEEFYAEHEERSFFPILVNFMTSGPVMALALRKENAIKSWRLLIGPTDSNEARSTAPSSLRALYGTDKTYNGFHGSDSPESSNRELKLVFGSFFRKPVDLTFALIKPDAVAKGDVPAIMERIEEEGFEVLEQKSFTFTTEAALSFYKEHIGKSFFPKLLQFMTSGPSVALALRREEAVECWRDLIGATDSDEAREEDPDCLRALYGKDKTQNAVHGSANTQDARRELMLLLPETAAAAGYVFKPVETFLAIIDNDALLRKNANHILKRIRLEGFEVVQQKKVTLTVSEANRIFPASYPEEKVRTLLSGPVFVLALRKEDGVEEFKRLLGPEDPVMAKSNFPYSIRAMYGADEKRSVMWASSDADRATQQLKVMFDSFVDNLQQTFALIKPDAVKAGNTAAIISRIESEGFEVVKREDLRFSSQQAMRLFCEHAGKHFYLDLIAYLTSGPVVALCLRKANAIEDFRALMGSTDSIECRRLSPASIRAAFGTDRLRNAIHGSDCLATAQRELSLVFGEISSGVQTTFGIIKPDAYEKRQEILRAIESKGFSIVKQRTVELTKEQVSQFYAKQAVKGGSAFSSLQQYMCSGPAMMLALSMENAVEAFSQVCGPEDPKAEVLKKSRGRQTNAKESKIETLRGKYGTTKLRNALHASKTIEDAEAELKLVFETMFVGVQTTLAVVKPDLVACNRDQDIIERIKFEGFETLQEMTMTLNKQQASLFYTQHRTKPHYRELVNYMCSGPITILQLKRENAVQYLRKLCGHADPVKARKQQPSSIRALFGSDSIRNSIHCCDSSAANERETGLLFETFQVQAEVSFMLMKPTILKKSLAEEVLDVLENDGYEIIAQKEVELTSADASYIIENTQAQKAALSSASLALLSPQSQSRELESSSQDYQKRATKQATEYLQSGPSLAVLVRRPNAVKGMVALCGDVRPRVAKKVNATSLRATYGVDTVRNGFYCSTSHAEAEADADFFFSELNEDEYN